jgi:sugar O-acyltransferase (sialic acid O-acetyltransferase NeuD family)
MHQSILVIGAGGHARASIDVIEEHGGYRIEGLVGMPYEVGDQILGYPVLYSDSEIPAPSSKMDTAIIALGQIKSPDTRIRLFELLQQRGWKIPTIISPKAHVSRHAKIGVGTIVMHGAIINAAAIVGRNCIINSQALVEHDAVVGDHCHIATSASINSGVSIGAGTFVGSGAKVRQLASLGERCVIGMGQCVLNNFESGTWLPEIAKR